MRDLLQISGFFLCTTHFLQHSIMQTLVALPVQNLSSISFRKSTKHILSLPWLYRGLRTKTESWGNFRAYLFLASQEPLSFTAWCTVSCRLVFHIFCPAFLVSGRRINLVLVSLCQAEVGVLEGTFSWMNKTYVLKLSKLYCILLHCI